MSFGLSLLFQLQDARSKLVERLFGSFAEQRILLAAHGRRDLRPVLRLQSLEGGREEITIFHHHVMPLLLYEIANDAIDIFPGDFTIRQDIIYRVSETA